MNFRRIDNALTTLLGDNANGLFSVEKYQRQSHSADDITKKPHVTVYYEQGQFPKNAGGPITAQHDMTFRVSVLVAAPAKMDLRVIDDPNTTPQQLMSALASATAAASNADDLCDETLENVYQIIRDPRNSDLGLPVGTVASPWIGSFQKDDPQNRGEYVVLSGSWSFTCRATEVTVGATPVAMQGIDIDLTQTPDQSGAAFDTALQGAKVGT